MLGEKLIKKSYFIFINCPISLMNERVFDPINKTLSTYFTCFSTFAVYADANICISKLGFWILTDLITGKVRIISPILSILEIQIFPFNILLNQTISFVKYMKILKFFSYAI